MKGVSSDKNILWRRTKEDDERRFGSVKRSSLGMPPCTPKKYLRRLKCLSLGMPPMHPLLHQQSLVRPSPHYIFITSCVVCYAWSVSLFTFLCLFFFVCCGNKLDPNLLFCVGEIHAPLELELLIGFACFFLLAVSCSFSFLSC